MGREISIDAELVRNIFNTVEDLLESTMATYEYMCELKRPIKHELDRHEKIILNAFIAVSQMKDRNDTRFRLTKLRNYVSTGDNPVAACHRFFLETRWRDKNLKPT